MIQFPRENHNFEKERNQMTRTLKFVTLLALALCVTGAAIAQTTTEVVHKSGTVLAKYDGKVVVQMADGSVKEFTPARRKDRHGRRRCDHLRDAEGRNGPYGRLRQDDDDNSGAVDRDQERHRRQGGRPDVVVKDADGYQEPRGSLRLQVPRRRQGDDARQAQAQHEADGDDRLDEDARR